MRPSFPILALAALPLLAAPTQAKPRHHHGEGRAEAIPGPCAPDTDRAPSRREDVTIIRGRPGDGWEPRDRVVVADQARRPEREWDGGRRITVFHPTRGYDRDRETRVIESATSGCERPEQVSVDRRGDGRDYHYYRDGRMVSEDRQGPEGRYHYYEDAGQISIDRDGPDGHRHIYIRK